MILHTEVHHKDSKTIEYADLLKSGFNPAFLLYDKSMSIDNQKLGVFIVPTGIGASVGGYAGDAAGWARRFSKV